MDDRDRDAVATLQNRFAVKATPTEKSTTLQFAGVPEKFNLSTKNNEFTIFTDAWHEHFADLSELQAFLDGLFSGRIQILVKYRGRTPVGHSTQVLKDGKVSVVSRTATLLPLFWRPKSYKTLNYTIADK